MTDWINVKDELPESWEIVWIFWRDSEVVLGCYTLQGSERAMLGTHECTENWYSFRHEKCRWTNWWRPAKGPGNFDEPNSPILKPRSSSIELPLTMTFKKYSPLEYYGKMVFIKDDTNGQMD